MTRCRRIRKGLARIEATTARLTELLTQFLAASPQSQRFSPIVLPVRADPGTITIMDN